MTRAPHQPGRSPRLPDGAAFAVVAASLVLVFLSSGTPIPVYNTYRAEDGVTASGLAITTVVYLATTAAALLTTGRLSNHLGRRPVAVGAVLAAALGCVVLMNVHGLGTLMTGRVLQGIACGVASSALGSYVLDTAPPRPLWLGAVITGSAPAFAIPVGALASGALVQYGPAPRVLVYAIVATVLAILAGLLLACPETVRRAPGALASLRPRVHVPHGQGRTLFAVGACLVATWSFTGFYQAFSPVVTADELGTDNALVVAVVFASVIILSPLGGSLMGRLQPANAVRTGLVIFVLATLAVLGALQVASIGWFLAASFVAGVAQGGANTGGMRAILTGANPADRAGLLATVYLISYTGAAAPGLVAGRVAAFLPPDRIALGYGVLVLVASGIAVLMLRNQQHARPGGRAR